MKRRPLLVLACAGVIGVAGVGATPGFADTPTAETPTAAQLADLTAGEVVLLDSDTAIDVVMDPTTGDIISVTAAIGGITQITNHSVCATGNGCYVTNKAPYADEGFYGSAGTDTGNWPDRSAYSSGQYSVSACWVGGCGIEIGPGSQVTFTSDVTGTSFTIY